MTSRVALMNTYAEPPVTFVRGEGTWLYDDAGAGYVDLLSGLAVTSLGHARPEVVQAVSDQVATLSHLSNLFGNEIGPEVASLLDELLARATGHHGKVFFGNSGAEANECALKLARRVSPGKHLVVSTLDSFHGRTLATLAATGQVAKHAAFEPLPTGFAHVAFGDLDAAQEALTRGDVAAVLVEVIQAEGGVNVPPPGYLVALQAACREAGALFMVDEIQTGMGRTGRWFAFEHEGLSPDVVTMAKALGNGMPVGACWARSEVADAFGPGDHGSTFGGQPLAMAAALATVRTMMALDAPALAQVASEILVSRLSDLDGVVAVRGWGLLLGAVLDRPVAAAVASEALRQGVIVNAVKPDVIRFTPPLTISPEEINEGVNRFGAALALVRAEEHLS
jgi:predicted acetylornithine/succinylornithine family transaminase